MKAAGAAFLLYWFLTYVIHAGVSFSALCAGVTFIILDIIIYEAL